MELVLKMQAVVRMYIPQFGVLRRYNVKKGIGLVVNPRRACTERVTVVVSCVYVCMSVRTRYSGSTHN